MGSREQGIPVAGRLPGPVQGRVREETAGCVVEPAEQELPTRPPPLFRTATRAPSPPPPPRFRLQPLSPLLPNPSTFYITLCSTRFAAPQ